ncbi:DUF4249 domain-containing protein [Sinomicrobium pectinilyticum]|uniref:DUF4249 domain-containing protein n=1 Tax=Sinomicrobium pectinilyticum TaxID=1084421 RepID=A0A3N0EAM5_SINP1|nr:DUF4249 domain-containing protein [Sinomicrobium pectinilyticum]RNL84911.1 DUF4249 domain-containing protein [Sinomicrobium pectinilyticum]
MKNINISNKLGVLLILIGLLNSCTDVIDVNVPNGGERLVVDASVKWQKGTLGEIQTIHLRESTGFFDNNPDVPVTGASVTVTKENDGSIFVFADQNDGSYTATDFVPELNASYTLEIFYNGNSYTATETLIAAPVINRIEQTIEEDFDDDEIQLQVFFDDPVDVKNYYLGEFIPSNLPLPSLAVISDEFTDGNENFIENDNENYVAGVTVDINVYGISQRYYDYLNILIQQSGSDEEGPFPTTPVQLKGNVTNVNDSNEEVLGYFRLGEFDTTPYTIE